LRLSNRPKARRARSGSRKPRARLLELSRARSRRRSSGRKAARGIGRLSSRRFVRRSPLRRKAGAARQPGARFGRAGGRLGTRAKFRRSMAAVVTCKDEQHTLPLVLRELERLPFQEIIVVINGSTDRSLERALQHRRTTVVWLPEALGHDVARAVGARLTTSSIVLFMDGDVPVSAEDLVPFLRSVERGADLALNDLSPFIGSFAEQDHVTRFKTFLNRALGRVDLAMNSMTAVPHAVSRRLLDRIGCAALAVPPKAQALAIMSGLKVTAPASVNVIARNRLRPHNVGEFNEVAELIIGDHLEAISLILQRTGPRGAYPDAGRWRHVARGEDDADEHHYSVV